MHFLRQPFSKCMAVYFEVADTTLILKSLQIIARNACLAESGEAWVKKNNNVTYTLSKKNKERKRAKKAEACIPPEACLAAEACIPPD